MPQLFDRHYYGLLRKHHGAIGSALLAAHWSIPLVAVPLVVGIPLSFII